MHGEVEKEGWKAGARSPKPLSFGNLEKPSYSKCRCESKAAQCAHLDAHHERHSRRVAQLPQLLSRPLKHTRDDKSSTHRATTALDRAGQGWPGHSRAWPGTAWGKQLPIPTGAAAAPPGEVGRRRQNQGSATGKFDAARARQPTPLGNAWQCCINDASSTTMRRQADG
ncbi:hypothetical protein PCL_04848 [Purpureocillium lilacinum]|uniref:Uncharacterized protein n=1 Tax=Purpureocillium lilacinum TaxID=33203 RepID=A0A2U3DWS7_PURLI|nr:hypothetical protein PCL_04848 [Purpureocillium lilacinum]